MLWVACDGSSVFLPRSQLCFLSEEPREGAAEVRRGRRGVRVYPLRRAARRLAPSVTSDPPGYMQNVSRGEEFDDAPANDQSFLRVKECNRKDKKTKTRFPSLSRSENVVIKIIQFKIQPAETWLVYLGDFCKFVV